jgi:molybdopterin/thiamine biosynthesis adenylyltransferase
LGKNSIQKNNKKLERRNVIVIFPEIRDYLKANLLKKDNNFVKLLVFGIIFDGVTYHLKSVGPNSNEQKVLGISQLGELRYNEQQLFFNLANNLSFEIPIEKLLNETEFTVKANSNHEDGIIFVLIPEGSNLYARIRDLDHYPLNAIKNSSVAIIGLGSGGSLISSYLAKSGLGELILIDGDVFKDVNIIRHICSFKDIGRYKTLAVKDYILERIHDIRIFTVEKAFSTENKQEEDFYHKLLSKVNLIVAAAGSLSLNKRINSFAYKRNIPVIYAGAFDKISGGLMLRVDPRKKSTCYNCIYPTIPENFQPSTSTKNSFFYALEEHDIVTQPGLGIDIDLITLPTVKFILSTLLNNSDSNSFPYDIYYWYNRDIVDADIESFVLYQHNRTLNKIPECNICSKPDHKVEN